MTKRENDTKIKMQTYVCKINTEDGSMEEIENDKENNAAAKILKENKKLKEENKRLNIIIKQMKQVLMH